MKSRYYNDIDGRELHISDEVLDPKRNDVESERELKLRQMENWIQTMQFCEDQSPCSLCGAVFHAGLTTDDWSVAIREHSFVNACKQSLIEDSTPIGGNYL